MQHRDPARHKNAPLPASKPEIKRLAEAMVPQRRAGDFAQAMMDLGATICTPRNPACAICPWNGGCAARRLGIAADLPRKAEKAERPTRYGVAFWIVAPDGSVLLRRRAEKGLLGGMMEVPSTAWRDTPWSAAEAACAAPVVADWKPVRGVVRHTFTHFHLELEVRTARTGAKAGPEGVWCPPGRFGEHALPTVMKKIVRLAAGSA